MNPICLWKRRNPRWSSRAPRSQGSREGEPNRRPMGWGDKSPIALVKRLQSLKLAPLIHKASPRPSLKVRLTPRERNVNTLRELALERIATMALGAPFSQSHGPSGGCDSWRDRMRHMDEKSPCVQGCLRASLRRRCPKLLISEKNVDSVFDGRNPVTPTRFF
jgi:hypothetical protein